MCHDLGMTDDDLKRDQGFRVLPPERRRQIAAMGGRAAHRKGAAHRFTPEEARAAAMKALDRDRADPSRVAARLQKAAETAARRAKAWL